MLRHFLQFQRLAKSKPETPRLARKSKSHVLILRQEFFMANIDVRHDKPTATIRQIHWGAAIWASIIGGLVFAVLEVAMVPMIQGKSPWAPLHMIGAIALGPGAMSSPDTFDLGIVATAVVVHLVLAVVYGIILAFIIMRMDTGIAVLVGGLYGLALYFINFYGFTRWFPWFADARDWISIFTHIVQSGLMAYLYRLYSPEPEPS